jgi:hypothetical protein
MKLPHISQPVVEAFLHSHKENPNYTLEMLETIKQENPLLYELIEHANRHSPEDKATAITSLVMTYALLKQQAEVDELNQTL